MSFAITGCTAQGEPKEVVPFTDIISEETFNEIIQSKESAIVALELEEKMNLVLDNAFEFEVELLRLAQSSLMLRYRPHGDAMQERLLLDRRLVNVLTACRLYLDHSAHAVSLLFGQGSEEAVEYKKTKSEAYDTVFGYRLMEALRNYVQHRGLLVHVISYDSGMVAHRSRNFIQYSVKPSLVVAKLEMDTKFKASILRELKEKGDYVDLRRPVREYVYGLVTIQNVLRGKILTRFSAQFDMYFATVERYKERDGLPVFGPKIVEIGPEMQYVRSFDLAGDFIGYYERLRERNIRIRDLNNSYASNLAP